MSLSKSTNDFLQKYVYGNIKIMNGSKLIMFLIFHKNNHAMASRSRRNGKDLWIELI